MEFYQKQNEKSSKNDSLSVLTQENSTKANAIEIPSISLPKGGGAIKGIDEKFQVNAANGTASFSIPIPFSPNRNGFTPQLSLSYNSGTGNGLFGIGWDIDLPAIQRRTDKKIPRYFDTNEVTSIAQEDSFMFSGVEELVPFLAWEEQQWNVLQSKDITEQFIIRQFRPRIEGSFSRIERIYHANHGYYWKITSKENITTFFGMSPECRIADPEDASKVFQWLPEFSYDDKGSWIWYQYKTEETENIVNKIHEKNRKESIAKISNQHIKRIKYGNQTVKYFENSPYLPELPINDSYFFELVFDYGEHGNVGETITYLEKTNWIARADAFSSCKSGFEVRNYRLCQRVLMFHHFTELGNSPTLVRSINFEYGFSKIYENLKNKLESTNTELTYLLAIEQTGYVRTNNILEKYTQKSLPKMTFEYQKINWDKKVKNISNENLVHAPVGLSENYQWTDLYNEGINGILTEQANAWYYKSNLGQAQVQNDELGELHFTHAQPVMPKPSFLGLGNGVLQLQDLDANGQKQLVVNTNGIQGYFELGDEGEWKPFKTFLKNLNLDLKNPNVRMLDVDGDGKPEIVLSEQGAFLWWKNEGKVGYDAPELAIKPYDEERGAAILFSDQEQRLFLADMTGDGLTDIVRIRNGEVCYWANMGYGRFGAKVTMTDSPYFDNPELFNPSYIQLADISGTGATDIIYLGKNKFKAYLNCSGNAWSNPEEIEPFFPTEQPNKITITDLLGNGTACIVWSSELPAYQNAPMRYIDLMAGKKPHIMTSHENGMGKKTEVYYKSSTYFYLKDKIEGTPWVTKLPFPVQVVIKSIVTESVTNVRFTSQYAYHHGYYDHPEKEFRGFGRVEQIDTEDFDVFNTATNNPAREHHQPPVLTKTWFHTGAFLDKERILSLFKHEYWYNKNQLQNIEHELPDAILLAAENLNGFSINKLSADEWREALRACKGMTLRQEVFGIDGSEKESLPYNVVSHNCEIQLLQHRGQNRYASFIVKESEAITYAYERNPMDPRIAHTLNLTTDKFGNVLESVSIVYPRSQVENFLQNSTDPNNLDTPIISAAKAKGIEGQKKMWITYSQNDFTTKNGIPQDIITPSNYYLRKGWQTRTYELTGVLPTNSIFSLTDFKGKINDFQPLDYEKKATIGKQKRLIEHIKTKFYNEELTAPLPDGEMAIRGISFESYQLAYTPNLLKAIFNPSPLSIPFEITEVDMLKGKFFKDNNNWWIQSGTVQYHRTNEAFDDVKNNFFAPIGYKDPFESKTQVFYDPLHLFMQRTLDAHQNETKVLSFNFRTLSPVRMRDVNDNISSVIVDELGLAKATSIEGKGSEGDNLIGFTETTSVEEQNTITQFFAEANVQAPNICNYTQLKALSYILLGNATARMVYDFSKKPCVVASIVREKHKDPNSLLQISFEYTDGLGKVAMKKVQAESGEVTLPDNTKIDTQTELRWVGNGRTVLNNKGNPIKQYEPYFSTTPAYENDPDWVERGVSPILYYDGAGRNIKTDLPNGTFTKVVFDAWKQQNYDVNDTVIDTAWYTERLLLPNDNPEKKAALKAKVHFDTPSIIILDTLGRPTLGIDQNRWEEIVNDIPVIKNETYYTFSDIDIEGNALSITDARGNVVMAWRYDMLGHRVAQISMDAGKRWLLNDGMGKPVRTFDERKHEFIYEYDALQRPIAKRVNGGDNVIHANTLYEKIEYGDVVGMTLAQREAEKRLNRVGKPKNLYDTAGKITSNQYDFKGNLLESNRTFAKDYKITPNWDIDNLDSLVETTNYSFTTKTEFDALNRPTQQTTPDGKITKPIFNTAGLLEKVLLNENGTETEFVKSIDYDEKGQRISIQYGNNVTTKYEYDPLTFRLKRLVSSAAVPPSGVRGLQDLNYTYDPTGNITQIADSAIPNVFFRNSRITATNQYSYDALYRLKEANGRESDSILDVRKDNWNDAAFMKPHSNGDVMAMRLYTQKYQYDAVGNIMQMIHQAGAGSWTRNYAYETQNNRLKNTKIGNNTFEYSYQFPFGSGAAAHGFITKMPHLSLMDWNFKEELQATSTQVVNNGGTPETTYYVYDSSGQRARKITENQATVGATPAKKDERIYVGSYEVYRNENNLERETLHIMDDKSRIAMLDTETEPRLILDIPAGRTTPLKTIRYQLSNHLGSTNHELDENAQTITYEEYHPYGTTAYQAKNAAIKAAAKRYRYTGMERDEETGLSYHSARYYLPWLGRWLSSDPIGVGDGVNLYGYCRGNPTRYQDLTGNSPEDDAMGVPFEPRSITLLLMQSTEKAPPKYRPDNLEQVHYLLLSGGGLDDPYRAVASARHLLGSQSSRETAPKNRNVGVVLGSHKSQLETVAGQTDAKREIPIIHPKNQGESSLRSTTVNLLSELVKMNEARKTLVGVISLSRPNFGKSKSGDPHYKGVGIDFGNYNSSPIAGTSKKSEIDGSKIIGALGSILLDLSNIVELPKSLALGLPVTGNYRDALLSLQSSTSKNEQIALEVAKMHKSYSGVLEQLKADGKIGSFKMNDLDAALKLIADGKIDDALNIGVVTLNNGQTVSLFYDTKNSTFIDADGVRKDNSHIHLQYK